MTRDPHCDGCKSDDRARELRAEVTELRAKLDALGEPVIERQSLPWTFNGAPLVVHGERTVYRSPWRPVSPETTP